MEKRLILQNRGSLKTIILLNSVNRLFLRCLLKGFISVWILFLSHIFKDTCGYPVNSTQANRRTYKSFPLGNNVLRLSNRNKSNLFLLKDFNSAAVPGSAADLSLYFSAPLDKISPSSLFCCHISPR